MITALNVRVMRDITTDWVHYYTTAIAKYEYSKFSFAALHMCFHSTHAMLHSAHDIIDITQTHTQCMLRVLDAAVKIPAQADSCSAVGHST